MASSLTLLTLSVIVTITSASVINFQSSPPAILPVLTDKLTFRCSLSDSGSFAKRSLTDRDVTATTDTIHHISSIVIERNGVQQVASVSQFFTSAVAHVNDTNLNVTGDITSGKPGERGFLQAVWNYPTVAQVDTYRCDIHVFNDQGSSIVFSKSIELGSATPTVDDVVTYIHQLQLARDEKKHVEQGQVWCGDSANWGTDRHLAIQQSFKKPFSSPPQVFISVVHFDDENDVNTRYATSALNVTQNGFVAKCMTWATSHIFEMSLSWIAIPAKLS